MFTFKVRTRQTRPVNKRPLGPPQQDGNHDLTSPWQERNVLPVAQSLEVSAEITGSRATNPR